MKLTFFREGFRLVLRLFFRIYFRYTVAGTENIPTAGPGLLVANHHTFLDPLFVAVPVKPRLAFMAWDRLFDIPLFGWFIRKMKAFPVRLDSPGHSSFKAARDILARGELLVIFPQAGRVPPGGHIPFKPGFARLALDLGAPIHPVTIGGVERLWPRGRWLPRPGRVRVLFHPAIRDHILPEATPAAPARPDSRRLAQQVEDVILADMECPACGAFRSGGGYE